MNLGLVTWLVDHVIRRRIDVRVRVHRASLLQTGPAASVSTPAVTTTVQLSELQAEILDSVRERLGEGTQSFDVYFINVWNASPARSVGVTHIWIATDPAIPVLTRQPPALLQPDTQWETWIDVDALPDDIVDVERLARIQLTNGQVVASLPREDVPTAGYVPG